MPNVVEVDIISRDQTDPGLASARAKVSSFKAQASKPIQIPIEPTIDLARYRADMAALSLARAPTGTLVVGGLGGGGGPPGGGRGGGGGGGDGGGPNFGFGAGGGGGGRRGGGGFGFFGFGVGLNTLVGGIRLWHVLLDGVLETLLAIGLATIAAAVGVTGIAEAAANLYLHFSAVRTVAAALGQTIRPLTGQLDKVATKLAPQAIELYGAAINVVHNATANFGVTAGNVVALFDTWAAKIVIWTGHQGGFNTMLSHGISYLDQFGHLVGTLGEAFGNLLREDPGIAHYLLDIVQGFASILLWVTRLPAPLVFTALALHGVFVWANVLAAPLLAGARALGILSASQVAAARSGLHLSSIFKFLAFNPYGWAVDAAAALGFLIYKQLQASNSAKAFVGTIETQLGNDTASQAVFGIASAVGSLHTKIAALQAQQQTHPFFAMFTPGKSLADSLHKTWSGIVDLFHTGFAPPEIFGSTAQHNIDLYQHEIQKLEGNQRNLFAETGNLVRQGYTVQQSWALMDLAGVKFNDTVAVMQAKVHNLIQGYYNLGVRGALLANSVNAVTFAGLQQQEKVGQLNQAWDTFFQTLSGGETSFVSFAQGVDTLDKSLKAAHASSTGLNANSLALRQNMLQAAGAANTEMDNLTLLVNAAGEGAKGTSMLKQATKDMLAEMLPAARGSAGLTAVLYGLAQRGGYRGADSFRALSQWIGKTHNPMQNLDRITTRLTVDSGNLIKDVQHLSIALGTTLNQAMATAILSASGGQKVFNEFAASIDQTGVGSMRTRSAAIKLSQELYQLTGNTSDAKSEFITFAERGLGLTKKQADALWRETLPALQKKINSLHGTSFNIFGKGKGQYSINEFGMPATPLGPQPGNVPGKLHTLAGGGLLPGFGGGDILPALLEPGETVIDKYRSRILAPLFRALGVPGHAKGGVVNSFAGNLSGLGPFFQGMEVAMTRSMEQAMINSMKSSEARASRMFSGAGGWSGGVAQWAPIMRSVLAAFGVPYLFGTFMSQMQTESGGNPRAINLWDSNAAAGMPSQGLMQVIPPTFYAYAGPYARLGIMNPLANIYAAVNYAMNRYDGYVAQVLGHGHGYKHGSDYVPQTGAAILHRGEMVIPEVAANAMRRAGGKPTLTIVVQPGGSPIDNMFVSWIQKSVRLLGGGDVQVAFGGRS